MVAHVISGETLDETLDDSQPADLLPYDKNCVAMTFSRLLGVGVYPTINFLKKKGRISKASDLKVSDLENDSTIETAIGKLEWPRRYLDTPWESVKVGMKGMPDGRYYATNWGRVVPAAARGMPSPSSSRAALASTATARKSRNP